MFSDRYLRQLSPGDHSNSHSDRNIIDRLLNCVSQSRKRRRCSHEISVECRKLKSCRTLSLLVAALMLSPARAADGDIRGCWKQEDFSQKYPRVLIYCFRNNGIFQGWAAEGGNGQDFRGTWELEDKSRFSISLYGNIIKYKYKRTKENAIRFSECNENLLNGDYNPDEMPED